VPFFEPCCPAHCVVCSRAEQIKIHSFIHSRLAYRLRELVIGTKTLSARTDRVDFAVGVVQPYCICIKVDYALVCSRGLGSCWLFAGVVEQCASAAFIGKNLQWCSVCYPISICDYS